MITVFYYPILINQEFIEKILINDIYNGALNMPVENYKGKYIPIKTDDKNNSVINYNIIFDTYQECAKHCNNINNHNHNE